MKSRVFTYISLLALAVAMVAAGPAAAQTSPADDVYDHPTGQVLDVVQGGGDAAPTATPTEDTVERGQAPSVCASADGRDANGNAVTYGSAADCAKAAQVCAAADGRDANGNAVAYGSSADCATTVTVASGQLPFTGFEAGLVALLGLGLLGGGVAMRRAARPDSA